MTRAIILILLSMSLPMLSMPAVSQDILAGTWGRKAAMPEPNSEFTATALDNRIYVLGGYPATRISVPTVQIYDVASNRWTLGPPLPQSLNHGMSAVVDGVIYLIGGQTDPYTAYVNTVYALDPKVGRWTTKAPMPTMRSAGFAGTIDGKIYVAGGRPPHGSDVAVYDPARDRWETLPALPTQRNHVAGSVIANRLVIAGGRLGGGFRTRRLRLLKLSIPPRATGQASRRCRSREAA